MDGKIFFIHLPFERKSAGMKNKGNILIVDDDSYILFSLQSLLERHFTNVVIRKNPNEIPSVIQKMSIDVLILDMNFSSGETSGEEGLKWIKKANATDHHISIVPITAFGGIDMAVESLKSGAVDFIVKPWQNEKMLSTITAAFNFSQSKRKITHLSEQNSLLSRTSNFDSFKIIGESPVMKRIFEKVEKVAQTDANVLLLGENGTGKELFARLIHKESLRKDEAFINVDLGSISESLFESELFGHIKGAFTDARENRIGRLEAADQGTLFLDEIGNIPLNLQNKLLSVLQNREIFRLGSNQAVPIDIRLICATNQDIYSMINAGQFRNDLFYRINTVEIVIPPLRNRTEDIPLIANFFIEKFANKYKREIKPLTNQSIKKLQQYDWPGNVRELQHTIEKAVILYDGNELFIEDFHSRQTPSSPLFDDYNLENIEKQAIVNCLEKHKGNITKAAEELGLTRGAIYRRFEKHGITKH